MNKKTLFLLMFLGVFGLSTATLFSSQTLQADDTECECGEDAEGNCLPCE